MDNYPAVNPEYEKGQAELDILREEAVRLLTAHDHLLHTVRPHLFALYQTKLGPWELELLREECATARLRRLAEMLQQALNAGRIPVLDTLRDKLDEEFVLWQTRLREAAEKQKAAEFHLNHLMTPEADAEFKNLYRRLVKTLHPDVAPANGERAKMLWPRVQDAYLGNDIEELRKLWDLARQLSPRDAAPDAFDTLRAACDALRRQIGDRTRQIQELRAKSPFTLEGKLDDDEWLATRRQEIETKIAELQARRQALEKHLAPLLPDFDRGQWIGTN